MKRLTKICNNWFSKIWIFTRRKERQSSWNIPPLDVLMMLVDDSAYLRPKSPVNTQFGLW